MFAKSVSGSGTLVTEGARILNGRYALGATPQSGGTATVYRASDLEAENAVVAVKVMKARHGHRLADMVFDREYKALTRLEDPNVVRLLDGGRDRETGSRFLVFEWVDGDLASVIQQQDAPIGWDDYVARFGEPLLSALARAHESGIAHRDIKPANILITAEGVLKVADFGIAKLATDIAPGLTVGDFRTEPFAAPSGEGSQYQYSADVYATAVTAFAVLSGMDPFTERFQTSPRTYVEEALEATDAPTEALTFLERCASIDPGERPHNAGAALAERNCSGRRALGAGPVAVGGEQA